MSNDEATRQRWDSHYREANDVPAMRVVTENLHLLPAQGRGLELACGLAANAMLLAAQGIRMDAWDISPIAVERVNARARQQGLPLTAEARNVVEMPPPAAHYDVIVVTRFLDRSLVPAIVAALRPQGLLFYQTFTRTHVSEGGPANPDWRLADNELLTLFPGLRVLVYREEGLAGDVTRGFRNEAMLVGQKISHE